MAEQPHDAPMSTFRPLGLGVRTGQVPINVGWPFPGEFSIYREGLMFRLLGHKTWIPRRDIRAILRGPGLVRILWSSQGVDSSATVSDWFRIAKIVAAIKLAGYRIDES